MRWWQLVATGVAALAAVTSALKVGPIRLPNNNRYINYTQGASPENSLLECVHQLEGVEEVQQVSWVLWVDGQNEGTFVWHSEDGPMVSGRLADMVRLDRNDGSLELINLSYELSGEYWCEVTLTTGEKQEAGKWEVLVIESLSHLSTLHRSLFECRYTSNYSTLAMFPEPLIRAGLYSEDLGGFYQEMSRSQWLVHSHDNGSVTYSYSDISFELNAATPVDISFYVMVGVMKADGNYIPISLAVDEHIILHHLGCPEPRVAVYQHIEFHRDTITCRGEHRETEATVTCEEGYRAEGDVEEVLVRCDEEKRTWVLQNGRPAKREDLKCVIDGAASIYSLSASLLLAALAFQKFLLL